MNIILRIGTMLLVLSINACIITPREGEEAPVVQIGSKLPPTKPQTFKRPRLSNQNISTSAVVAPSRPNTGVEISPYITHSSADKRSQQGHNSSTRRANRASNQSQAQRTPDSPAIVALLDSASREQHKGRPAIAAATLERALRIEPHNARLWYRLAAIRLDQGRSELAISLAKKSNSLAGEDMALRKKNERLIYQAKRKAGF